MQRARGSALTRGAIRTLVVAGTAVSVVLGMVVLALPAGMMLISASAPGTTGAAAPNPAYPAVYAVTLNHSSHVAFVRPLFYDESQATTANGPHVGKTVKLGLTDPDSNEAVPSAAPSSPAISC